MNLNMFDDISGLVLRERENTLPSKFSVSSADSQERSRFPADTPLGMAYVPFQQWGEVYEPDKAFCEGTLFPELNFPFERGGTLNG